MAHLIMRSISRDGEQDEQFDINIPSSKESFWRSHITRDAIVKLIKSADLTKWQDSSDELSLDDFWVSILKVIVEQYYIEYFDSLAAPPANPTYKSILSMMIDELDSLDEEIPKDEDDEDFDEE